MSNKIGVALTKEVCPICLKEQDGAIVMNTILTENRAKEVESLHGKVVGYLDDMCDECKETYNGKIAFIECLSESNPEDPDNPYRTGLIFGITIEVVKDMIEPELFLRIEKFGFSFIDEQGARDLLGSHYPTKDEH